MSKLASAHPAEQLSIVDFSRGDGAASSIAPCAGLPVKPHPSADRKGGCDTLLVWLALSALVGALSASLCRDSFISNLILLFLITGFVWILQSLLRVRLVVKLVAVAFIVMAFAMTASRRAELTQRELDYLLGQYVTISGSVSNIDAVSGRIVLGDAFIQSLAGATRLASALPVAFVPGCSSIGDAGGNGWLGQSITVRGVLSRPADNCFSFQGKPSSYLASRGMYFQLLYARPDRSSELLVQSHINDLGWSTLCLKIVNYWRSNLISFFKTTLSDTAGQLIASMVMGDRAIALSSALKLSFNKVGLSHLLAASGMNLTIILGFILALSGRLQKLGAPLLAATPVIKHLELAVCVFSVLGFSLLAGSSPSVFRATVMCLIALFARCIFRQITAVRALALALLLSIWLSPVSVFDIGLQLSYAATFGVLCLYPLIDASLKSILPLTGKWWQGLISLSSIVLAAQCAVLPLQLYYFGQFSTVFLLANTLAEPIVAPITVLGFVATLLVSPYTIVSYFASTSLGGSPLVSVFAAITRLLLWPASWVCLVAAPLIMLLCFVVQQLSILPLANLVVARPAVTVVLLSYGLLLLLVYIGSSTLPTIRAHRTRLGFVALLGSFMLVLYCLLFAPSLEILSGRDSFCLRRAGQFVLLQQAGTDPEIGSALVQSYLRSRAEPLLNMSGLSHYSDSTIDYSCRITEGLEELLIHLKKDNIIVVARRHGNAPYATSCQPLTGPFAGQTRFSARPTAGKAAYVDIRGDLALSNCLPYFNWSLPLYPTLSCHVEQVASRYFLSFAL